MKVCSIENCDKPLLARGWCSAHYNLWRKHGKPERTIGRHGRGLKDPTYLSWTAMTARCTRGKYKDRFTIDSRWTGSKGFENFLSDMGERPDGKTLDRTDNTKGYAPDNCRWATPVEQRLNCSQLRLVEYKGKTQPLSEHCKELDIPYLVTLKRLKRGWSVKSAFEKPLMTK